MIQLEVGPTDRVVVDAQLGSQLSDSGQLLARLPLTGRDQRPDLVLDLDVDGDLAVRFYVYLHTGAKC